MVKWITSGLMRWKLARSALGTCLPNAQAHSSVIDCGAVSHAIQGSNDKLAWEEYRKELEVWKWLGTNGCIRTRRLQEKRLEKSGKNWNEWKRVAHSLWFTLILQNEIRCGDWTMSIHPNPFKPPKSLSGCLVLELCCGEPLGVSAVAALGYCSILSDDEVLHRLSESHRLN